MLKNIGRCSVVVLAALVAVGCSKFLDTQKKDQNVLQMSDARLSCLKDLPKFMENLLGGRARNSEIGNSVLCVERAMDVYKKRYRGTQENAYTQEDLRNFFNRYFFADHPVSPKLASDLLRLKKAFFGGSDDVLEHREMDEIIQWFKNIKAPFVTVAPDFPYFLARDTSHRDSRHEVKIQNLKVFLVEAARRTSFWSSNYNLDQFHELIQEFLKYAKTGQAKQLSDELKKYYPLLPVVKKILIPAEPPTRFEDFEKVIETSVDIFGAGLKAYHDGLFEHSLFGSLESASDLMDLMYRGADIAMKSPLMLKNRMLVYSDIEILIDELCRLGICGQLIKPASGKIALKRILLKIFSEGERESELQFTGVRTSHLELLKREIMIVQASLNLFKGKLPKAGPEWTPITEIREMLGDEHVRNQVHAITSAHQLRQEEESYIYHGVKELQGLLSRRYPLQFDQQRSIRLFGLRSEATYVSETMAQLIMMKTFSRLLHLGYGLPISAPVSERHLTIHGLNEWYNDFRSIGIDLRVFDPRTHDVNGRFYEANFFTFAGNGDNQMQYGETFEYLSFLFSAGVSSAENLRSALIIGNCQFLGTDHRTEIDIFGQLKLDKACIKRIWKKEFKQVFYNLPGMGNFMEALVNDPDESKFDEFFKVLEIGATGSEHEVFDTGHLRAVVAITHYIESLFTQFDTNGDQILSYAEIKASSPRFLPLLAAKSTALSYLPLRYSQAAYEHLVVNGELPTYHIWRYPYSHSTASRMNLFKVLMVLSAAIR